MKLFCYRKWLMVGVGRAGIGLSSCFRFEWRRRFEYWDRYLLGPLYVLVWHEAQ